MSEDLLYGAGNPTQHLVVAQMGRKPEREGIYVSWQRAHCTVHRQWHDIVKQLCDLTAGDSLRPRRWPVSKWCGTLRWLWDETFRQMNFPQEEPMLSASAPTSGTSWLSLVHSPPTPAAPSCLPVLNLREVRYTFQFISSRSSRFLMQINLIPS